MSVTITTLPNSDVQFTCWGWNNPKIKEPSEIGKRCECRIKQKKITSRFSMPVFCDDPDNTPNDPNYQIFSITPEEAYNIISGGTFKGNITISFNETVEANWSEQVGPNQDITATSHGFASYIGIRGGQMISVETGGSACEYTETIRGTGGSISSKDDYSTTYSRNPPSNVNLKNDNNHGPSEARVIMNVVVFVDKETRQANLAIFINGGTTINESSAGTMVNGTFSPGGTATATILGKSVTLIPVAQRYTNPETMYEGRGVYSMTNSANTTVTLDPYVENDGLPTLLELYLNNTKVGDIVEELFEEYDFEDLEWNEGFDISYSPIQVKSTDANSPKPLCRTIAEIDEDIKAGVTYVEKNNPHFNTPKGLEKYCNRYRMFATRDYYARNPDGSLQNLTRQCDPCNSALVTQPFANLDQITTEYYVDDFDEEKRLFTQKSKVQVVAPATTYWEFFVPLEINGETNGDAKRTCEVKQCRINEVLEIGPPDDFGFKVITFIYTLASGGIFIPPNIRDLSRCDSKINFPPLLKYMEKE